MRSYEFHGYMIVQGESEWFAFKNGKMVAKAETSDELEKILS